MSKLARHSDAEPHPAMRSFTRFDGHPLTHMLHMLPRNLLKLPARADPKQLGVGIA
jgi:hypothetical protein